MIEESLRYSDYEIWETKQSKIDPEKEIQVCTVILCPHCKKEQLPLDHNEKRTCMECGLRMELQGNCLTCRL